MTSINVQYFALLRVQAGTENETISADVKTYGDLYDHLKSKHNFTLPKNMIQVAVNDEFSELHLAIEAGARVVFIPPVAGG
jgi:sulfur-carrier protein